MSELGRKIVFDRSRRVMDLGFVGEKGEMRLNRKPFRNPVKRGVIRPAHTLSSPYPEEGKRKTIVDLSGHIHQEGHRELP